jgi:hypothetical protein
MNTNKKNASIKAIRGTLSYVCGITTLILGTSSAIASGARIKTHEKGSIKGTINGLFLSAVGMGAMILGQDDMCDGLVEYSEARTAEKEAADFADDVAAEQQKTIAVEFGK